MPGTRVGTGVQCRVVCAYVTPQDLTKPTANLWGTLGVMEVTQQRTDEGVVFTVTIDPSDDTQLVINRLRSLATSWGKGEDGFPAVVEV